MKLKTKEAHKWMMPARFGFSNDKKALIQIPKTTMKGTCAAGMEPFLRTLGSQTEHRTVQDIRTSAVKQAILLSVIEISFSRIFNA